MSFRFVKDMPFDGSGKFTVFCNKFMAYGEWHNCLDVYCDDELTRTSKPFPNDTVYVTGEYEAPGKQRASMNDRIRIRCYNGTCSVYLVTDTGMEYNLRSFYESTVCVKDEHDA